jgi:fructose-1,6-bisphosphatase/inositol monophosphatase family enzyme
MKKISKKAPVYSKELALAKAIALKAGKVMMKYYDIDQQPKVKIDNSMVTIADIEINDLVIKELKKAFPKDGVIGEEKSTSDYGMGRKWFCDPIDGTAGYIWGTPTAMFSLALVVDGQSVVGVAYDPFQKRMYYAVRGNGAFCNGKKIRVSDKKLSEGILAVTGGAAVIDKPKYFSMLRENGTRLAAFSGLVHKGVLVARGRLVGFIEHTGKRLSPSAHDIAALHVIVEEAGGRITDLDGNEITYSKPIKGEFLISNNVIHEDLLKNYPVKLDATKKNK